MACGLGNSLVHGYLANENSKICYVFELRVIHEVIWI